MKRLYDKNAVSDLVLLETIDEDNILKTLRERHKKDMIYTYIGSVLLSVNPFKLISNLYTPSAVESYRGRYMYELPPHVYALSEDTYRSLLTDYKDQCVIISGESGAGKTEASKKIMEYIAAVSGSGDEIERVKDQILKSNPVLEAFGNAKTVRNDNSSRFGKYMEIYFDFRGDPVGGRITNYLLEKSRVVQPALNERSFHIFYQLCAGLTEAEKKGYYITKPDDYAYLRKSQCFEVERMDDKADFELTIDGMSSMGMTDDEIGEVFRVVSAVMWLGNVEFVAKGDKSDVADAAPLKVVSHLLGCTMDKLQAALTSRTIEAGVGMQAVQTFLDKSAAEYTRDALAKVLYFRLFDWIVARINTAIDLSNIKQFKTTKGNVRTIGVLDIYGFEIFETNSFEQFCINYCNEKLQQIFIEKTLKSEQDEYKAEGIDWVPVDFFNNKIVCDLIEGQPRGLLAYLDEESLLGEGTDMSYLTKITRNYADHPHFAIPKDLKGARNTFLIKHYAGNVQYSTEGFIDKNKDLVWKDLLLVGESSDVKVMSELFPAGDAEKMGKKRPVTTAVQFMRQIGVLMKMLGKCTPHYIRCIKPNAAKRGGVFDDELVLHQVRYLGLLENVRVRRAGFASRMIFSRFLSRYKMLSGKTWPSFEGEVQDGVIAICSSGMGMKKGRDFQMGKTMVFIRDPVHVFALEEQRERKLQMLRKHGDSRIMYVDAVKKINNKYKTQTRIFLLSENAIYNLDPGSMAVRRRIALDKLSKVSVSSKGDDYMVLHVADDVDYLIVMPHKIEFLMALAEQYKITNNKDLPIDFADSIAYYESAGVFSKTKEKEPRHVNFVECKEEINGARHLVDPEHPKTHLIVEVGKVETDNERHMAFLNKIGKRPPQRDAPVQPSSPFGAKLRSASPTPTTGNRFAQNFGASSSGGGNSNPTSPRDAPQIRRLVSAPAGPSKDVFCKALHNFQAEGPDELSFNAGDVIKVLSQDPDGWWKAELNGKVGHIPKTYVQLQS